MTVQLFREPVESVIPDGQHTGNQSENNAHPHMSDDGNVVAVHNGIIENYQELKEQAAPQRIYILL